MWLCSVLLLMRRILNHPDTPAWIFFYVLFTVLVAHA